MKLAFCIFLLFREVTQTLKRSMSLRYGSNGKLHAIQNLIVNSAGQQQYSVLTNMIGLFLIIFLF